MKCSYQRQSCWSPIKYEILSLFSGSLLLINTSDVNCLAQYFSKYVPQSPVMSCGKNIQGSTCFKNFAQYTFLCQRFIQEQACQRNGKSCKNKKEIYLTMKGNTVEQFKRAWVRLNVLETQLCFLLVSGTGESYLISLCLIP